MLDSISYPELLQWGEYYAAEPFGEWRGDVRAAQVCSVLANVNRDPKTKPEPFSLEDFMLFDRRRKALVASEVEEDGAEVSPQTLTWLFAMGAKAQAAKVH